MTEIKSTDFDIKKIAESGQCFRMDPKEDGWQLVAKDRVLMLRQLEPDMVGLDCSLSDYLCIWSDYFDMQSDYAAYRAAVDPADSFLSSAAEEGKGIRILRQDPWEMLITFIISQRKNIPAIKNCVETISRRFGKEIEGSGVFAFPTAESLAKASDEELRACSLGYRAPYISAAARMAAEGTLDLDSLFVLPNEELLEELMKVPGVGPKVGNCISLFAYHRIDAFPIDVWIRRMLDEHYGGVFPLERYKGFAGVMQQYIFYHAIKNKQ